MQALRASAAVTLPCYQGRMARILVLPPGLVNQIAAGEVVERPASVAKELLENALDAGARQISVESEAGLSLVEGGRRRHGDEPEDARLALERHATSKLKDAEGLAAIATLGFRGEAIPAIASVSRGSGSTPLLSRRAGTRVVVEGGTLVEVAAAARPRGTTVEVRDLFFRHAGSASSCVPPPPSGPPGRGGHPGCAGAAGRGVHAAIGWPHPAHGAGGGGDVRARRPRAGAGASASVAGGRPRRSTAGPRGGLLPDHSGPTSRALYLLVNGRYVRDRGAAHAVLRAFADHLPAGRPAGVLFLEVPLSLVDVNVHPQKLEVRFADAREAYDAVFHAVASTLRTAPWLGRGVVRGSAARGRGALSSREEEALQAAEVLASARERAAPEGVEVGSHTTFTHPGVRPLRRGDAAPSGLLRPAALPGPAREDLPRLRGAGGGPGDNSAQHASHERLLFERLREAQKSRQLFGAAVLAPAGGIAPTPPTARALEAGLSELSRLGIEVEPFGGDSFAVKGAPSLLAGVDLEALLSDVAGQLADVERDSAVEEAFHGLLATMACHAAVRANQELGPEEARALLDGLDAVDFKARWPPMAVRWVFELSLADLERAVGGEGERSGLKKGLAKGGSRRSG